jgi:glycosyltransferase involved in cell wall biosynthesis
MKTAIIWHSDYPWDIRIEKFCGALIKANNEVIVICKGKAGKGIYNNVPVFKLAAVPLFFNPLWIYGVIRVIKKEKIELIIIRDLPLALTGGLIGRILHIPVILDMAENYPAALLAYQNKAYKPFLFANAFLPRLYEKIALKFVDKVIVVTEEQKERLEKIRVSPQRISIIGNTPDYKKLREYADADGKDLPPGPYLFYSGFMDVHRGIKTLILAFNEIKDKFPDLILVLAGKGKQTEALKKLAVELNLSERVIFKGWLDFKLVPYYIKHSRICIIPHLKSEHTETTMPNKIFDYMYFNKPVVVSDIKPLMRVSGELNNGAIFESGNYEGLGQAIEKILNDESPDYGTGQKLVETKYNWDVDSGILINLVGSLKYAQD